MEPKDYYILFLSFMVLPFLALSQVPSNTMEPLLKQDNRVAILPLADSIPEKVNAVTDQVTGHMDSVGYDEGLPVDTLDEKIALVKRSFQARIDSLNAKGGGAAKWQQKLDSLEQLPGVSSGKYQKLVTLQEQWEDKVDKKFPDLNGASPSNQKLNEKVDAINEVSTELGVGPLGNDLNHDLNLSLPDLEAPRLPITDDLALEENALGTGMNDHLEGLAVDGNLENKIDGADRAVKEAGGITKEVSAYSKDLKVIQEEGLRKSEKLPELAEQQALQVDEIQALQKQHNITRAEAEKYQKLIEQYKEEKRVLAEMEEKSKELANDVIMKNQGKVDESMKKIGKAKRKFPEVHDMRDLPRRVPNAMKGLGWRERLVPGFTFQTLNGTRLWLEFDPQVYYKLNAHWSVGAGGMYRFSMDPDKLTLADFGSMYGGKILAQYHAFKGFFIRSEIQYVVWEPWHLQKTDPDRVDKTYVGVAGIGKSYTFAKKIKGNAQVLYHHYWDGADPYKPKIMIRLGFDFSIKKREEEQWKKRVKGM